VVAVGLSPRLRASTSRCSFDDERPLDFEVIFRDAAARRLAASPARRGLFFVFMGK
jgi:hypothetical protein